MNDKFHTQRNRFILGCVVLALLSCSRQSEVQTQEGPVSETALMVADVAQLIIPGSARVRGYGIVGHLAGTGSNVCPERIKAYLKRTIPKATVSTVGVEQLIASDNTAVVLIEGSIFAGAIQFDTFDLKVTALDDSGLCSLHGGWLYPTDLRLTQGPSAETSSSIVASAKGPLFLDKMDVSASSTNQYGYILGGGQITSKPRVTLRLNEPSFGMASAVQNAINRRFGSGMAKALSPAQIDISIPLQYRHFRDRFFSLIKAIYLDQRPKWIQDRAAYWAGQLIQSNESSVPEIALEAIGRPSMTTLAGFLSYSEERVRLAAARCLSSLSVGHAVEVLLHIAADVNAAYRKEAIAALAMSADSPQVIKAVQWLLEDNDFDIVLEAYEKIVAPNGTGVSRLAISQSFTLDLIPYGTRQAIVATRKESARIALFGTAIQCKLGYSLHSETTGITLDTHTSDSNLIITRDEASRRWTSLGPLRCDLHLSDLIQKLGKEPVPGNSSEGGLGISYADILAILKTMCDEKMVDAEFWAGPLPKLP